MATANSRAGDSPFERSVGGVGALMITLSGLSPPIVASNAIYAMLRRKRSPWADRGPGWTREVADADSATS